VKAQRTLEGLSDRSGAALCHSRTLGALEVIFVGALLSFFPTFLFGTVLVGLSLRLRRVGLDELGWSWEGMKRGALLGLGAGARYVPLEELVVWPALLRLVAGMPGPLPLDTPPAGTSSVPSLAFGLVLHLLVSPLLEETVYRGYMIPRVAGLLGFGGRGWFVGVLLSSLLFGLAHLPVILWLAGVSPLPLDLIYALVLVPIFGLVAGSLYLASGRRLIAPFVFHALTNVHIVLQAM
jgi:membrane protease YdiL (CAAX protease family)